MRKVEKREKIYPEYLKKYSNFNLNVNRLQMIENLCNKEYDPSFGIERDLFIRINLNFEVQAQLIKYFDASDLSRYRGLVTGHSKNIVSKLSDEEIDIIFEDTIDYVKENYNREEILGSFIMRNFKNNLIKYVNESYNQSNELLDDEAFKINLITKK